MSRETNASDEQISSRDSLKEMYQNSPVPIDDLMTNLGLYIRGSALVKFLVINDLYLRIKDIPGVIAEFGVWYGQNLVLFENLRAIYEPFNKTRQILGFDTFKGYEGFTDRDVNGEIFAAGNYATLQDYKGYVQKLIGIHENNNILGHVSGNHTLIEGDVCKTAPEYFSAHPELTVALAYFDMGLYAPTKAALQAIKPHLIPGSVILLDEFSWSAAKGEAIAFKEVFGVGGYKIEKSPLTPMRAIVTIL